MFSRKIFSIIACSLMLIGISSCATNKEPFSQSVVNPSGLSEIPFKAGEMVIINTKSKIHISSRYVEMVTMAVKDVNATRIMGEVDLVCCDYEAGTENVAGEIVEVDIDNIAEISLYEEMEQKTADSGIGAQIKRDAKKIVKDAPKEILKYCVCRLVFNTHILKLPRHIATTYDI